MNVVPGVPNTLAGTTATRASAGSSSMSAAKTIIVELVGPVAEALFASGVASAQPIVDSLQFGPGR